MKTRLALATKSSLPAIGLVLAAGVAFLAGPSHAKLDAVTGASENGQIVFSVDKVVPADNSVAINFSEAYDNGSLRFYYSTNDLAKLSDTGSAGVVKKDVTPRGGGQFKVTGLTPGTAYHYRFQGYYTKNSKGYDAYGSFTTTGGSAIAPVRRAPRTGKAPSSDAFGRSWSVGTGVSVGKDGSTVRLGTSDNP